MLEQNVRCTEVIIRPHSKGVALASIRYSDDSESVVKSFTVRGGLFDFSSDLRKVTIEAFRDFAYMRHGKEWDTHCEFGRGKKVSKSRIMEIFKGSGLDAVIKSINSKEAQEC